VHRSLHYRLEVFKTPDRGWSVRSWDRITAGSLVCVMTGHVTR
jgi:euchromatic histone-lysine N-methyltransferase